MFPTQIIVTNELDKKNHAWLTALTEKMQKNDMRNLIEKVDALTPKYDRGLALTEGIINAVSLIIDLGHPSEIAVSQTALKYQMTEEEVLQIWLNRKK